MLVDWLYSMRNIKFSSARLQYLAQMDVVPFKKKELLHSPEP